MTGSGLNAKLVVTSQTTAAELEAFGKEVGADAQLRGKAHKDGSVTLYARDHGPGLMSRLINRHERREAAVMAALRQVDGNVAAANAARGGRDDGVLSALLSRPDIALKGAVAEMAGRALALCVETPLPKKADSPRLAALMAGGALTKVLSQVGTELAAGKTADHGIGAAKGLLEHGLSYLWASQQHALVASSALTLKGDIESALRSAVPDLSDDLGRQFCTLADTMVEEAVLRHADGQLKDDGSLVLNGTTYSKVKVLGAGGFGEAVLYETADKSDRLVLKLPLIDDLAGGYLTEGVEALQKEVLAHRDVGSSGHANVLGFRGAVRLPEGAVGVAMQVASPRNVGDVQAALGDAVRNGHLTQPVADVVALTLLADVGKGLRHMHDKGQGHLDLKPVNIFLGTDGTAMVADFGTATRSRNVAAEAAEIEQAGWKPPEACLHKSEAAKRVKADTAARDDAVSGLTRAFFADPKALDAVDARLMGRIHDRILNAQTSVRTASPTPAEIGGVGYDLWSLGVTGLNIARDTSVGAAIKFDVARENAIGQLAVGGGDDELVGDQATALFPAMASGPVRDLVNDLLRPRPEDRLALDRLDRHDAFATPGVGTDAARDLIKALMAGADGTTLSRLGAAVLVAT